MHPVVLAAMLAVAPPEAGAEPPTQPLPKAPVAAPRKEPESVWRPTENGGFEHLQSGLRCPATVGDFQRSQLATYDPFGLDVSCGYSAGDSVVTLYLSRMAPLEQAYAVAKTALDDRFGPQGAKLTADGRVTFSGAVWLRAQYTLPGRMRSDIWITDFGGWLLKFRMTYPEAEAPAVDAQVAALTALAQSTAAERIRLCAKTPPPARPGKPAKARHRDDPGVLASLLAGSVGLAAADDKGVAAAPITYCVEEGLVDGNTGYLGWRGVTPDGADARTDRLTLMTIGPPPAVDIALDETGNIIAAELSGKAAERWTATLQDGRKTHIFGYYDKRPSAKVALPLVKRIFAGKAEALGGYDADGKQINITLPK